MFGLNVNNDSGSLQLSSSLSYLCAHAEGQFTFGAGTYARNYNFPSPLAAQHPPLIFVRVVSTSAGQASSFLARPIGSPGNWTGFQLSSGNTSQSYTGLWFAATFQPRNGGETFGLKVWNETGVLSVNSAQPIIRMSRFITSWGNWRDVSGGRVWEASSGVVLQADEYVMVNQFITSHVYAGALSYMGITIRPSGEIRLTVNQSPSGLASSNIGYFAVLLAKRKP